MPNKAYAFIHDGTDLLLGSGGGRGKPLKTRTGNHLPGGTVDPGNSPAQQLMVELPQEMGITLAVPPQAKSFVIAKAAFTITFFVIAVPSVQALIQSAGKPTGNKPFDQPFANVRTEKIAVAKATANFFNAMDETDWFGEGMVEAVKQKLL